MTFFNKLEHWIKVLLISTGLLFVFAMPSITQAQVTNGLTKAEDLQALKNQLQSTEKEVLLLKEAALPKFADKLDMQDKRLADFATHTAWLGSLIGILGILVTVILFLLGYFTYSKARSDAIKVATDWFDQNENGFKKRIAELESSLTTHAAQTHYKLDEIEKQLYAINSLATTQLGTSASVQKSITELEEQLNQKPKAQYKAEDFYAQGILKLRQTSYLLAYEAFVTAANMSDESTENILLAKILFAKGIVLGELNRSEEEIEVYKDVVKRFGASSELALQEQVAMALVNQGVRLGTLNRSEEEIEVYKDVVKRFGASSELALQEQVAMASELLAGNTSK